MCRLFGFRSRVQSKAHRSLVVAENAIAEQAQIHCDGWGIGYYLEDEPYIFKSAMSANGDRRFESFSEKLHCQTMLVHVRRATVGQKDSLNSHPFRYGTWMFAHNGTLFEFDKIKDRMVERIEARFHELIFGTTDSEHFFYYLLSEMIREGVPANGRGDFDLDRAVIAQTRALSVIFAWCKELNIEPPKANYILTNGRELFARRAGLELLLSTQKRFCSDALTCNEVNKSCLKGRLGHITNQLKKPRHCNHLILSSEPIGLEDIWEEVPEGHLISLDSRFNLRLHEPPTPFWVTWPPVVTRPPRRKGIIHADAVGSL